MSDLQTIWNSVLELLQKEISAVSYDVWIKPLEPVTILNGKLVLLASSLPAKNVVTANYLKDISAAVARAHSSLLAAEIIEPGQKDSFDTSLKRDNGDGLEGPQYLPLNPKYTFSNFVVGPNSRFVDAAARAVANAPGEKYNPLFLHGGVGLGKTHIMHAIGNELKATRPELKVAYIPSETFTNEIIDAIFEGKDRGLNKEFKRKYRSVDVLMIDDIQFIGSKPSVQEEFFHTFNELYQAGKQIVLSSDRPPHEISKLEDRLKSRFEQGLLADIQPPDSVTRVAILQKKAQAENYNVPKDVMDYIAEKFVSNIRLLEGALARVVFYASLLERPLSVELAKEAVKDYLTESKEALNAEVIIDNVCTYYRVSRADIIGKKRDKEIVRPRQMCMYLISELLSMPLSGIGGLFGGRDHTTVMHARDKITELYKTNQQVYAEVTDIKSMINKD